MKKIRIICMLFAIVLVLPIFASCSSGKVTATVSLKFVIPSEEEGGEDEVKLNLPSFAVEGSKSNPPAVLQAVQEALQEYEITYELTSDGRSIAGVYGLTEKQWYDDEYGYYTHWECTINGLTSTEGRQSETKIYDTDEIVFTWKSGKELLKNKGDTETVDPSINETGTLPALTTAEEE